MRDRNRLKQDLKRKSKEAAERTDAALEGELAALLEVTRTDLDTLRPKVTDKVEYDRLIAAVAEATQRNENVAQFRERIEKLGKGAVAVAKQIAGLLSGRMPGGGKGRG